MKNIWIVWSIFCFLSYSAVLAEPRNDGTDDRGRSLPSLLFSVLDEPNKARVNGVEAVSYELVVTNLENREFRVEKIEVLAGGQPIKTYSAEQLPTISKRLERGGEAVESSVLPAKETLIYFLWLESTGELKELTHRVTLDLGDGLATLSGAPTKVVTAEPVVVGLPFRKAGRWAAIGAPSNEAGHRRAAICVDGRPWISQRFAIDWVLLGEDGRMAKGDGLKNEDHYCYGVEALAVADGEIVEVYDKVPTNIPSLDKRAVPITLETVGGNWVALKIADGRYGMYAHLIPGSLKVKKGDRVKKGDVVGLVGNTGNSTAPHLHFHVSTTPHWINSVGVPYLIDSYSAVGTFEEDENDPDGHFVESRETSSSSRRKDLPAEAQVILVEGK